MKAKRRKTTTATLALIPAAGRGARFTNDAWQEGSKVFAPLLGQPILRWTAERLAAHPGIDGLLIVAGPDDVARCRDILSGVSRVLGIVPGGGSRQESVAIGLYTLGGDADDFILVHDGARPLVSSAVVGRCLAGAREHAVAALPVADTLKRAAADQTIAGTVERADLWAVQTPQVFRLATLFQAHARARAAGFSGTDEASLVERFGDESVHLVSGSPENLKITLPEDLAMAEAILSRQEARSAPAARVGFGYDVHRLAPGRRLVLGGVAIPFHQGLLGHSDADVVLHALMDALLGAAALPDIGHLFPNTDEAYAGADSAALLEEVRRAVLAAGYKIVNVDMTVIAEAPKIAPFIEAMRQIIAGRLQIDPAQVGIKATTHEGLGALGAGLGIAAHAVASLTPF